MVRSFFIACIVGFNAILSGAEIEKLIIIGGGPAGLTAAIFAGQANLNPLVIEGCETEGQFASVYKMENFPGFPDGISGKELVGRIHKQAELFGARYNLNSVIFVDLNQYPFKLVLDNSEEIYCESIIIATGASPRWLDIEGEREFIGKGVSASAALDGEKFAGKEVIVIGGGDSALEQALLLAKCASKVTIVHKERDFNAASYLQERVLTNDKIVILFNTDILKIFGNDAEKISGVILYDKIKDEKFQFCCSGVFISNGRKPNTDLFAGQLEMNDKGNILTKSNSTHTSVDGVFAAGDITQSAYRKTVTAVAAGCMSAIDATKFHAKRK